MTEAVNVASEQEQKVATARAETAAPATSSQPKYPAMEFVVKFSKLLAMVMILGFLFIALYFVFLGIFSESVRFTIGLINAGFYLLIGSVCVALVKGMGEAFEVLLELEKRK